MKLKFLRHCIPCLIALSCLRGATHRTDDAFSRISSAFAGIVKDYHYAQHPMDDTLSKRVLAAYLDKLDADHLFFLRKDIGEITRAHDTAYGREIAAGRHATAFAIYDLYRQRVIARIKKILAFLDAGTFDFNSDRSIEVDRSRAPWPADEADADQLWRNQIEGELLDEKLGGTGLPQCIRTVRERYEQFRRETKQQTARDILAATLSAYAHAYDPHSDYLTKSDLEDLDSDMRLSMVGIGVVVVPDGRYIKIVDLLPGSPASRDSRLKPRDRIVAIGHGNGDFVDVGGMNFNHVIELIRAKQGSKIRLKIIGARESDSSQRTEVDLVSRKIELTTEEATAQVVSHACADGKCLQLGWIDLPSFYGDPEHPRERSATRDMLSLLNQLNQKQIAGLVLDLRGNPGGELEEAVNIAGLFLGPLPIVKERDANGKIYISKPDEEKKPVYSGPLIVLTNHLTASAAELLASALKDYHRAVIIGGYYPTFGKGSIQSIIDLGDVMAGARMRAAGEPGAVDLTIGKFYRVNGASTQLHGIDADISLPSPEDLPDEGESALKNPLPYDETDPLAVISQETAIPLEELRLRSSTRVSVEPEFRYLREDLEFEKHKLETNRLTLNETARHTRMEEEKTRENLRKKAREQLKNTTPAPLVLLPGNDHGPASRKSIGKAGINSSGEKKKNSEENRPDPVRGETLNILGDFVDLTTAH